MRLIILLALFFSILASAFRFKAEIIVRKDKLSEYGFFAGTLSELSPVKGVLHYDLNTPLFSNYAEKLRFIVLPEGQSAAYRDSVVFDFPKGTVLIKNFYYPLDFRHPKKGRRILETRLLVHTEKGWEAWPYIWNDEQTDAYYDPAGETKDVTYIDAKGKKKSTKYAVPNKNQCKGCHISGNQLMPIGLTARQLNRNVDVEGAEKNQLDVWISRNLLSGLQSSSQAQKLKVWNDVASGSLNERARAYLDANCAHCHSRTGPASTSGLFLDIYEANPVHLGVNKTPVAAGRGSGNLAFDIVPGSPEHSILVYRMKTTDPGIAMPEIGREQIHSEGVALIEEWIRSNPF